LGPGLFRVELDEMGSRKMWKVLQEEEEEEEEE